MQGLFGLRSRLAGLAGLVALAVGVAGCDQSKSDGSAAAAPAPPTVTVAKPLVKSITEWDEFTGRFEPVESVEIRARVGGYLDSADFTDGQIVQKGQQLFVIDPRPFEIALQQAEAQVTSAQASLALARQELARSQQLVASSNISRSTNDQRVQEQAQSQADLDAAQAAVRKAVLDLGFTHVEAPLSGRISNRRVDVGNLVNDNTLLTTIVALDPLYFDFDMSETDYLAYERAVLVGKLPSTRDKTTPVGVRLVDEEGWPHQGTMNFVDNVVDRSTGTIHARAVVPNPDLFLTPGQFGRLRLPASPEYDALLIPDAAIVTDQSRRIVMSVAADGTVVPKVIRPGPSMEGLRIVRSGLTADDQIIINGLLRARPGGKVTPEPGKIETAQDPS